MRYYLIDLENVPNSLHHINKKSIPSSSNLVVFYTKPLSEKVRGIKGTLEEYFRSTRYIKVETGIKNSLDFNLVCYLGMLVGSFHGSMLEIYVVSNDSGYSSISRFLSGLVIPYTLKYKVIGESALPFIDPERVFTKKGNEIPIKVLSVLFGGYSLSVKNKLVRRFVKDKKVADFICSWLKNIGSTNKQDLYVDLRVKFGTKGTSCYCKLKETKVFKSEVL